MANITYIIGNGLDLSLGLKTSYRDFYDYVKKQGLHPENSIYLAIAQDNPELWADFELGLGRYTNTIETVTEKERVSWSQKLNTELDEIKRDLKLYITERNAYADAHIPNIKFKRESFFAGLETGQIAHIQRRIGNDQLPIIRFITLNYTDVLEKLFPSAGTLVAGQNYVVQSPIHHVHGSIIRRLSLGVNDDTQLSSYIDQEEKNYLIKPELIRLMNDGRLETLTEYIDMSDVMVMFGVSLGATDRYIWRHVINWLSSSADRLLIIHQYEDGLDVSDLTERESLQLSDRVKNKFLSHADISDIDRERLKRATYVIPNTTELFAKDEK